MITENAINKFSRATWRILSGFQDIHSFRDITNLGLPFVTEALQINGYVTAEFFRNSQTVEHIFEDREEFFRAVEGIKGFANKVQENRLSSYRLAIDSASLIFAHSILDACTYEYLEVVAEVSPESFERFVEKQKISLEDLQGKSYAEVLNLKVRLFLDELEKKSLLAKTDKIFQICQVKENTAPILGFKFDRDRLEDLDTQRHDAVHRVIKTSPLKNGDEDLMFLQQSGLYLMNLLNGRFGIKMSPRNATYQ